MAETQERVRRQTAMKARIRHIREGRFIRREGWDPSYVLDLFGRHLVRINLMAALVSDVTRDSVAAWFIIDDGSGQMQVRHFESQRPLPDLNTGDVILVIGRVRVYNDEFYIIPEIVKPFQNTDWLRLRNAEMDRLEKTLPTINLEEEMVKEEENPPEQEETSSEGETPSDRIYKLIKEKDGGEGVDVDDIITTSGFPEAERIISNLLLEGEIFEIKPGRVKSLD